MKAKTIAERVAVSIVKEELKKQGHKISHFSPYEIRQVARELIRDDPMVQKAIQRAIERWEQDWKERA